MVYLCIYLFERHIFFCNLLLPKDKLGLKQKTLKSDAYELFSHLNLKSMGRFKKYISSKFKLTYECFRC